MQTIMNILSDSMKVLTPDELKKLTHNIQEIKNYIDFHDCKEYPYLVGSRESDISDSVKKRLIKIDKIYFQLFKYPSEDLKKYALGLYPELIGLISCPDEALILLTLSKRPDLYNHFTLSIKNKLKFIELCDSNIQWINTHDSDYETMCRHSLDINWKNIQWINEYSLDIVRYAYNINHQALMFIRDVPKKIWSNFLTENPYDIFNFYYPNFEMEKWAICIDPKVILMDPSHFRADSIDFALTHHPYLYPYLKEKGKHNVSINHFWLYLKYKFNQWKNNMHGIL